MDNFAHLIPVTQKASNVCSYCRVRKQKCDRSLPRCQRCAAKGRDCDYTPYKEPPRPEDPEPEPLVLHSHTCMHSDLSTRGVTELLHAITACINDLDLVVANARLSELVYEILYLAELDLPVALEEFKLAVQRWCPIMPPEVLSGCGKDLTHHNPQSNRVQHPVLALCLWLVTRRVCGHAEHVTQCQLYRALKQMLALLQSGQEIKLVTMQLQLFIAVYELGHGLQYQAFQTLAGGVALLRMLELNPRNQMDETTLAIVEWLKSSAMFLDRLIPISMISASLPPTILINDPIAKYVASELGPTIPPPSSIPDPTNPRKIHVRGAVALASGHVLEYTNARHHGLGPEEPYDQVDEIISNCIKMLVDKPESHSWLYCDGIAMAFCSNMLLQKAEMFFLSANMVHFEVPPPGYIKAHLALKYSRRMAWDMVKTAILKIGSESEFAHLPLAGLTCVCMAGLAVLETREFIDEDVMTDDEVQSYLRILSWFSGRWGVGAQILNRVEELLRQP